jgi:hypothetical protein
MRERNAELDAMLDEAFVDAYGEEEQLTGLFTMLEEHLELPFHTEVLGVQVEVCSVDLSNGFDIVAVCRRSGASQRISLQHLPLPEPAPAGAEWIAAYRYWRDGL